MRTKKLLPILFVFALALCLFLPMNAWADVAWTPVSTASDLTNALANASSDESAPTRLRLTADINLTAHLEVASGKHIFLDLNGHVIDRNLAESEYDRVITVAGNLTIQDSRPNFAGSSEEPRKTVSYANPFTGASVPVNGGVITGGNLEHDYYGGGIGGGIYVSDDGKLTLNGGTIVGNTAVEGGGVYVGSGCFTMTGGTIAGNSISNENSYASALYLEVGTFELSGGTITGNKACGDQYSAAVFAHGNSNGNNCDLKLSGNIVISGNKARDEEVDLLLYGADISVKAKIVGPLTGGANSIGVNRCDGNNVVAYGSGYTLTDDDAAVFKSTSEDDSVFRVGNDIYLGRGRVQDLDVTVENINDIYYTGNEIKPNVIVKDGEIELSKGRDYTVSYSNNQAPGQATITITGDPFRGYYGKQDVNFEIKKIPVCLSAASYYGSSVYYGTAPGDILFQLKFANRDHLLSDDWLNTLLVGDGANAIYTTDYSQYDSPGTYIVTPAGVTLLSEKTATHEIVYTAGTFTVKPKEIRVNDISWGARSIVFDGEEQCLTPTADGAIVNNDDVSFVVTGAARDVNSDTSPYTATIVGLKGADAHKYVLDGNPYETFYITKKDAPTLTDININIPYTATTITASVAGKMPADAGTVTYFTRAYDVEGSRSEVVARTVPTVSAIGFVEATIANGQPNDTVSLLVKFYSTNYRDATVRIVFTLVDKVDAGVHFDDESAQTVIHTYDPSDGTISLNLPQVTTSGENPTWTVTSSNDSVLANGASGTEGTWNFDVAGAGQTTVTFAYRSDTSVGQATTLVTINPATVAIPTAATGLRWTGSEQTGVEDGTLYTVTNGKATAAGEYTALVKLNDKGKYCWSDGTVVTKNIAWSIGKHVGPAAPSGLTGTAPTTEGGADGVISGVSAAMEYSDDASFSAKTACTGDTITGLTAGTYYVRVAETATHEASAATMITVPTSGTSKSETESHKGGGGGASAQEPATATAAAKTLKTANGSTEFSKDAMASIIAQAGTDDVSVTMETKTPAALLSSFGAAKLQAAGLSEKALEDCSIIDLNITAGGKLITRFGGKSIRLTFPISGKQTVGGLYKTIAISADGTVDTMTAGIENQDGQKVAVVDTTHATVFIVTNEVAGASVNNPFTDVKESDYFFQPVLWAVSKEVTGGVSETSFAPNAGCTRAQMVTFLWRAAGKPWASANRHFSDVADGAYYKDAIEWAVAAGITNGISDELFNPDGAVTREQLASFIYRYAQSKGQGFTGAWMFLLDYSDASAISSWADEAMHWCVMQEIVGGTGNGKLSPQGTATRGQIVTMLYRYFNL